MSSRLESNPVRAVRPFRAAGSPSPIAASRPMSVSGSAALADPVVEPVDPPVTPQSIPAASILAPEPPSPAIPESSVPMRTEFDPRVVRASAFSSGSTPRREAPSAAPETVPVPWFEQMVRRSYRAAQSFAHWYYGPLEDASAQFTNRSVIEAVFANGVLATTLIGSAGAAGAPQLGIWLLGGGAITTISGLMSTSEWYVPESGNPYDSN